MKMKMNYKAVRVRNSLHKLDLGSFLTFTEAKKAVDKSFDNDRRFFGNGDSIGYSGNSASLCPYRIEVSEMTAEAGLIKDIYYVEKVDDEKKTILG